MLIVSLIVIVVAFGVIVVNQLQAQQAATVDSVGSRDLNSIAAQEPSPTPSPTPTLAPSTSASASPSPSVTEPATYPVPVGVTIPAINVSTKVLPVGLDPNQALEIPEDITKVGWYELGVPPGSEQGSAVLVAHRDGRVQGHGVFYNLGALVPGNKILVTTADGGKLYYKVVARELISKKKLPYDELFAIDGPARLTLISCGGYYDKNNGGYQDNIVVTAVPLTAAA